jgi:hypothetical protein
MPLANEPIDFKLDADGDLVVPIQFVSGLEAVAQGIRVRLKLFRGEWFLNLDEGVPYFEDLLGRKFDRARAREIIRTELLKSPGVVEITSLTADFDGQTRALSVDWAVRTEFGDTSGQTAVGF